ncbi:uncharacterized protein NP_5356A [Natronomonas pharaonis DSM 2160]|uniref:DUF8053 domain-containing protein n=1 Tax=Natronomonas pharaonis (strain ATCC 35678 / DSM 2160 / CIP 103997 / JCM 8858 / NBRC 14720 / NCIMB 2260 / Gabara) TaxID=348780 RepID=A0A1U7EZM5_NATPD|nr:hypothetical protein [Natronomonas pharaonis]CAI50769.1 uncharacterized protein NP_5356A [Natronomonas pharaonis DSM 2160]
MPIRKLRQLDDDSAGVTLPKDDLRENGLLGDDGQIEDDQHVVIEQVDDGEWTVRTVDVV